MNKYNKILKIIILIFSSLSFIFLLISLIFYLADIKLNNELKMFFSGEIIPFVIIGLIFFGLIIGFEIKTLFNKQK